MEQNAQEKSRSNPNMPIVMPNTTFMIQTQPKEGRREKWEMLEAWGM